MKEEVILEGIVLKVTPYKEKDGLVVVYFKDYGKLSLLASGIYKPTSKNASACQPFVISEFTFILKDGLCKLIKATVKNQNRYLIENIECLSVATFIAEYYVKVIEQNKPKLSHYHFLRSSIRYLNEGYIPLLIYLKSCSFILNDCGSKLEVDHCVFCDSTNKIASISVRHGGFVCINHLSSGEIKMDVQVLKAFRMINKLSIDDLLENNIDLSILKQEKHIFEDFLDEYSPIVFSSRKFI